MDFMQHLPVSMSRLFVSVLRRVDSAIHWIVIFQLPRKGIKSNDVRDIELAGDKQ